MYASIIICTYNREESLADSIESVLDQTYSKKEYEVLVIDDGSTDNTEEIVKKIIKNTSCNIKYFKQNNQGLSIARNCGITKSEGDIVSFIDDDCITDKDWLKNLMDAHKDEDVMAVGGKVLSVFDRKPTEFFRSKVNDGTGFFGDFNRGDMRKEVDWLIGCNMSFRKSIFEKVGFFDSALGRKENLFLSYEELDICYKISELKYKIIYEPKALVFHKIPPDNFTYDWCFNNAIFSGISKYRSHERYNETGKKRKIFTNSYDTMYTNSYDLLITFISFIKKRDLGTMEALLNSVGYVGEKYLKISNRSSLITFISSTLKLFLLDKKLN